MIYLVPFATTIAVVLLTVPWLMKLAIQHDFMDKPTKRKKHKNAVPLVGGMGMFIGFALAFSIFVGFSDIKYVAILLGAVLILGVGIIDDYYKTRGIEFAVLPRVLVQLTAASIVFFVGIRFTGFMNPVTDVFVMFPMWLQFFLTVAWIFGVTTVINFSDGLDGLAGGLCSISSITLFIVAIYMGQTSSAIMCAILLGACLGFLKYNIFPAKIFMGDSGANFLGYLLAVISLYGTFKQATIISIFIPVLALGVPIFDNIFVVIKRFIERKPIYKADASQIHYRLLKTGLNPAQVVMFLCLISVCLNLTSIIILLL